MGKQEALNSADFADERNRTLSAQWKNSHANKTNRIPSISARQADIVHEGATATTTSPTVKESPEVVIDAKSSSRRILDAIERIGPTAFAKELTAAQRTQLTEALQPDATSNHTMAVAVAGTVTVSLLVVALLTWRRHKMTAMASRVRPPS